MNKSTPGGGKWFILLSFVLIIFTLPLQACKPAAPAELDHIKFAVHPYLSFAPIYIAQAEGYFTEENLEVEFIRFEDATQAFPMLIQGDIDVAGSALYPGLFNAILEDQAIKIVADRGNFASDGCIYQAILATPAWIERYNASPADAMRGVRISFDDTNFEGFIVDFILKEAGVSLEDIVQTDLPPTARVDAVLNDQVDVLVTAEPWKTRLLDTSMVTVWRTPQEFVPDMQFGTLLYGTSLLNDRPEVGVRFMKAFLKAVHTYNEGTTDRNLEIVAEATGLELDILQRACWPPMRDDGVINTDTIDQFQQWALSAGFIDQLIPVESYWDPSFIEEAGK